VRILATVVVLVAFAGPRVGSAGVTVSLPPGWHATRGFDGPVTDPVTRIVVASGRIGVRATQCQVAHYAFASTGVAIVVLEWRRTYGATFPPRPRHFAVRVRPGTIECFAGAGGSVEFRDHGRNFGAYLLIGKRARPGTVATARRVLDSLQVE
jgi:hypothetical protein